MIPTGTLNGESELDERHARALDAYFTALRMRWPKDLWGWMRHDPHGIALREALLAQDIAVAELGPRLPRQRRR